MTGPTYRVVARFFFEGPPRLDMAHRLPVDQAHRHTRRDLCLVDVLAAIAVFVAGIVGIALLVTVVLAGIPQ